MARKKKKSPGLLDRWRSRWAEIDPDVRHKWLGRAGWVSTGTVLLAVVVTGLWQLKQSVNEDPRQQAPPRIRWVDLPPDLKPDMDAALEPFRHVAWAHPTLCADIARKLKTVGWVATVESVHRFPDRWVEVRCQYRRPAAMVQVDNRFYLIDLNGVRLPGIYRFDPQYPLIQGTHAGPPAPGETWNGDDLQAGLSVAQLIAPERFAEQITAVLVQNYGGRVDPHAGHLQLATDRAGGRIVWGSAPGAEIEENPADKKLEMLRSNYNRYGRVDANRAVIDISVLPNRIITSRSR